MDATQDDHDPVQRAQRLVRLFYPQADNFGGLQAVPSASMPEPYRGLLDHRSHMTVAMEGFHGAPVSLRVVASKAGPAGAAGCRGWYGREILLLRPDGCVVQYGIVRIDLDQVDDASAAAIRAAEIPLGRILIQANLLRDVHDVQLLEIEPGPRLQQLFAGAAVSTGFQGHTFGRVAEISLGGQPAVELLEIAAPGLLPKALR